MRWALVNEQNIVINIIAYNGSDPFIPPQGIRLREVQDWLQIGLDADIAEHDVPRTPVDPVDPVREKAKRDAYYKNDLSMIALFNLAKQTNPQLQLSAYLDSLEVLRDSITIDVEVGS